MDTTLQTKFDLDNGAMMTEDGSKQVLLSPSQRQALEWLINGGSITEAAQYAGVTRATVSRWINDDEDFRALFEHWQRQVKTTNQARLVALSEIALDTVAGAIREQRDVKTALAVLKGMGVLKVAP